MNRKDWDIVDWKIRCSELAFEVERLHKDSKRLEWLVMNRARVWLQDGWYDIHDDGGTCIVQLKEDWRDAIDEAMESE